MKYFKYVQLIGLLFFLLGTFAYTNNWLPEDLSKTIYLLAGVVMLVGFLLRKKSRD